MILKNPTDNEVRIQVDGVQYSVMPQGTVKVSEKVGLAWRKVHQFLAVVGSEEEPPVQDEVLEEENAPEVSDEDADEGEDIPD